MGRRHCNESCPVVTALPIPEHRAEVIAAFERAIVRVRDEPGVERYALLDGTAVLIEKYESEQARAAHSKGAAQAQQGP
jgi:quinol monooxygenase YgiN